MAKKTKRAKKNDNDADDKMRAKKRTAGVATGLPSNTSNPQVSPLPLQVAPIAPTGAPKTKKPKGFKVSPVVSPQQKLKNAMGKIASK